MQIPVAIVESGASGLFDAYAYLRYQLTSGNDGGTVTTGSFQTRPLNTEVFDSAGIVSLSANQFTLQTGSYLLKGRAPFFRTAQARLKIRNITDSTDEGFGDNCFSQDNSAGEGEHTAHITCPLTVSGTKVYELQYRCSSNDGGNTGCQGKQSGYAIEIYAELEIFRFTS